jgi:sugar O-acyltransferase (sialic acid O-acetyltransferase NeuD family)
MKRSPAKPPLAIWGASGHALVMAGHWRQGTYEIAGFLDEVNPDRWGSDFCGVTILGGREQVGPLLSRGVRHILLGFGHCGRRLELTDFLQAQGFSLPIAIHPHAVVAEDVVIGAGTVIAAGAVVNPAVRLGRSVIINTSASVDHECEVGDAAHICPRAHLAGQVRIGEAAQVGIGATVVERVSSKARDRREAVVVTDIPAPRPTVWRGSVDCSTMNHKTISWSDTWRAS